MAVAADLVVALHGAFLVFVGVGAVLVRWVPAVAWSHVPAVAWAVVAIAAGVDCPLTAIEKRLRTAAGQEPYAGGFVDHHVEDVLYPDELTPALWGLAAVTVALGYGRLLRRPVAPPHRA